MTDSIDTVVYSERGGPGPGEGQGPGPGGGGPGGPIPPGGRPGGGPGPGQGSRGGKGSPQAGQGATQFGPFDFAGFAPPPAIAADVSAAELARELEAEGEQILSDFQQLLQKPWTAVSEDAGSEFQKLLQRGPLSEFQKLIADKPTRAFGAVSDMAGAADALAAFGGLAALLYPTAIGEENVPMQPYDPGSDPNLTEIPDPGFGYLNPPMEPIVVTGTRASPDAAPAPSPALDLGPFQLGQPGPLPFASPAPRVSPKAQPATRTAPEGPKGAQKPSESPRGATGTQTKTQPEPAMPTGPNCLGNRKPGQCRQGYFREKASGAIQFITWSYRKCPSLLPRLR